MLHFALSARRLIFLKVAMRAESPDQTDFRLDIKNDKRRSDISSHTLTKDVVRTWRRARKARDCLPAILYLTCRLSVESMLVVVFHLLA